MCGRFLMLTIAESRRVAEMRCVDPETIPEDYRPRYNIAPTDPDFIVTSKSPTRDRRALDGVTSWAHDASRTAAVINAMAEIIDPRGGFPEAFAL